MKPRAVFLLAVVLALVLSGCAITGKKSGSNENYPSRPITYIVPFAAGGGSDTLARIISSVAPEHFGQPMTVQIMDGSSGVLGWREMLKRPADGYTVIMFSDSPIIALLMEGSKEINPREDFRPISPIRMLRSIMIAKPGQPWSTWDGFVEYAKAHPGELTLGGTMNLLMYLSYVLNQAGTEVNLVYYDSSGDALTDLLGGHIDLAAASPSGALPVAQSGDVVAVFDSAPIDKDETPEFANMVTAKQAGFDGMAGITWFGMHPDTPDEIIEYASQAVKKMWEDPSLLALYKSLGEEPYYLPWQEAQEEYYKAFDNAEKFLREAGFIQ